MDRLILFDGNDCLDSGGFNFQNLVIESECLQTWAAPLHRTRSPSTVTMKTRQLIKIYYDVSICTELSPSTNLNATEFTQCRSLA